MTIAGRQTLENAGNRMFYVASAKLLVLCKFEQGSDIKIYFWGNSLPSISYTMHKAFS